MRSSSLLFWLFMLCCSAAMSASDPLSNAGNPLDASASQPKFLPVAKAYPTEVTLEDNHVNIDWNITDGYYLYKQTISIKAQGADGAIDLPVELPTGEAHEDEFFGKTEVYRYQTRIQLPRPDTAGDWTLTLKSQGCADAGLCYPPRTQHFDIFPGTLVGTETKTPLYLPGSAAAPVDTPSTDAPEAVEPSPTPAPSSTAFDGSFLYMALLAALGGIILNLMPCVFPVLSLKILKLSDTHDGSSTALHCVAYTVGVVLSFVVVALVLITLRSAGAAVGWGFHLQSPVFVGALAYLFLAMGLGLSGMVNLGSSLMGLGNSLADHRGYLGSFFTGILATVVASPCTAPFMGTALGFAMTQPPAASLGIFAALGLGMALPFLVFAMSPALMRLLPKPGAWMEAFKQLLAFPLYAAAVWLLWVLGKQAGVNAMAMVAGGGVLLALSLWVLESAARASSPWSRRVVAAAIAAAAIMLLGSRQLEHREISSVSDANWERYSEARLEELRASGQPVFINMTADWCITCLTNERVALSSERVESALQQRGITYLKGDWTNADPAITAALGRHGRTGVPLYLVYGPGAERPIILPQLLTPGIVMDAFDEARIPAAPAT